VRHSTWSRDQDDFVAVLGEMMKRLMFLWLLLINLLGVQSAALAASVTSGTVTFDYASTKDTPVSTNQPSFNGMDLANVGVDCGWAYEGLAEFQN
jgi:hypothetical protein